MHFHIVSYIKLQFENTPNGNIWISQISCFLSKMYTLHITYALYHNDSLNRARSLVKRQLQLWVFLFWFSSSFSSAKSFFMREVAMTYGFFLMLVTHNSVNQTKKGQEVFLFYIHVLCILSCLWNCIFCITLIQNNLYPLQRWNLLEKLNWEGSKVPSMSFYPDFVLNLCIQIISRFYINIWKIWIKCG